MRKNHEPQLLPFPGVVVLAIGAFSGAGMTAALIFGSQYLFGGA